MKISRTGSTKDHGTRHVALPNPKFGWSKSDLCLTIRHSRAKDFGDGSSHHSYFLTIPAMELNELLAALAKAALSDPSVLEAELGPSLKSLTQLQAVTAGLKVK